MKATLVALLAVVGPSAALAQDALVGDPAAGEKHFNRQCIACHVVRDEAGEVLAGRSGRTGPNLYGVIGQVPGSDPDFDYSDLLLAYAAMEVVVEEEDPDDAAGAEGGTAPVVWEEENFVGFVQDPTDFLREATGESGRSKMAYQVRDEQEAHDLYAYLATFSPPAEIEGEGTEGNEAASQ